MGGYVSSNDLVRFGFRGHSGGAKNSMGPRLGDYIPDPTVIV